MNEKDKRKEVIDKWNYIIEEYYMNKEKKRVERIKE